jgi:hypothetical protein
MPPSKKLLIHFHESLITYGKNKIESTALKSFFRERQVWDLWKPRYQRAERFLLTYRYQVTQDAAAIEQGCESNYLVDSLRNYMFNISYRYKQYPHPIELFE